MTWLTPASSALCLHLVDTSRSDAQPLVLDIHPTRWQGPCFEHAVLSVLGMLHQHEYVQNAGWREQTPLRKSYTHPDFFIETGGLSLHTGAPLPAHHTVSLDATHLHLPDGRRFERAVFSPYACDPAQMEASHKNLGRTLSGLPPESGQPTNKMADQSAPHHAIFLAGALGALSALEGRPFWDWGRGYNGHSATLLAGMVVARIGLLSGHFPRSGKEAAQWAEEAGKDHARNLLTTWTIRPNSPWNPTHWARGTDYGAIADALDPLDIAAGQAACRAVLDMAPTADALRALESATSAHAVLAMKGAVRAMDTAILRTYAVEPSRLKPRAAARARAL